MTNKVYVSSVVAIFVLNLIVCGSIFAQGPISNAQEFQQKAIDSALKSSKYQNFGAKREYIEWVERPVAVPDDEIGKRSDSELVGSEDK